MTLSLLGIDFATPITAENRVVVTGAADSGEIKQSTVTWFADGLSMTGPCTIGLGTQTFHAAQRSEVLTVASDLTTLDGTVTTLSGDLTTLDGTVTTLSGDLTTLDGTVTTLSGDFTAFEADVNARLPNGTDGFVALFDGSGLKTQDRLSQSGSDLTLAFPSAASASDTPTVNLRHDRTPGAADVVSQIRWYADDSAGNDTEYAAIGFRSQLSTDTVECGDIVFRTSFAGAMRESMYLGLGVVVGQPGSLGPVLNVDAWQTFASGKSLLIGGGQYAFAYDAAPSAGLAFNVSGFTGFDFRNGSGNSIVRLLTATAKSEFYGDVELMASGGAGGGGDLILGEASNIIAGTTTGTKIGTSTTQKLGFFNATPVTRPTAISSPAANVTSLKTAVDAIRTRLTSLGLTA